MMRWPFAVMRRDETVDALRANVRDLQLRLNRTKAYAAKTERGRRRAREQQQLDRLYLEKTKAELRLVEENIAEAWDWVTRSVESGLSDRDVSLTLRVWLALMREQPARPGLVRRAGQPT